VCLPVKCSRHHATRSLENPRKASWHLQVGRIRAATAKFNEARLLVDSTGVGEPIYESLCAANCLVQPYTLTARSKNDLTVVASVVRAKGGRALNLAVLLARLAARRGR